MLEFDLIILDCDGVLVDSEPLAARAMAEVLGSGGVEVSLEAIAGCVGMKLPDIIARLETVSGQRIAPELVGDLWPATRALFAEHLVSTPGIAHFLETIGIPTCVASSSDHERIAFSLATTGLDKYFPRDRIFSSHEVKHGKPAPDLVLHAAGSLGAEPKRCVVIEDSRFGVMGAVAAGMLPIGYVGGTHSGEAEARMLLEAGAVAVEHSWDAIARRLGGGADQGRMPGALAR